MDPSAWDDKYAAAPHLWSIEPNVFVADRLATVPPGRGVDLACGEGRNAIWLAGMGWEMTGVDFSPVAIDRARSRSDSVVWVEADVTRWEPGDHVDLVLIAYLQVASEVLTAVTRRAASWLDPGGQMLLVGHDVSNLAEGHGGPQVPEILWQVDDLVEALDGLSIVEAGVLDREVALEGGGVAVAKDTVVRASALA